MITVSELLRRLHLASKHDRAIFCDGLDVSDICVIDNRVTLSHDETDYYKTPQLIEKLSALDGNMPVYYDDKPLIHIGMFYDGLVLAHTKPVGECPLTGGEVYSLTQHGLLHYSIEADDYIFSGQIRPLIQ